MARYNPVHMARTLDSTPARRWLLHARRILAARRLLDALARAARQLARWAHCPRSRLSPNVAAAIARFEPVTRRRLGCALSNSRARSSRPHVRVVEMSHDDAWMRDVGPTFVTNEQGRAARRRLALQRLGRARGRALLSRGTRTISSRSKVLEIEGCDRYRAPIINEGGAIHVDGEGTALVTEQVPAEPESQPRHGEGRDRAPSQVPISACSPSSGWARA